MPKIRYAGKHVRYRDVFVCSTRDRRKDGRAIAYMRYSIGSGGSVLTRRNPSSNPNPKP